MAEPTDLLFTREWDRRIDLRRAKEEQGWSSSKNMRKRPYEVHHLYEVQQALEPTDGKDEQDTHHNVQLRILKKELQCFALPVFPFDFCMEYLIYYREEDSHLGWILVEVNSIKKLRSTSAGPGLDP